MPGARCSLLLAFDAAREGTPCTSSRRGRCHAPIQKLQDRSRTSIAHHFLLVSFCAPLASPRETSRSPLGGAPPLRRTHTATTAPAPLFSFVGARVARVCCILLGSLFCVSLFFFGNEKCFRKMSLSLFSDSQKGKKTAHSILEMRVDLSPLVFCLVLPPLVRRAAHGGRRSQGCRRARTRYTHTRARGNGVISSLKRYLNQSYRGGSNS